MESTNCLVCFQECFSVEERDRNRNKTKATKDNNDCQVAFGVEDSMTDRLKVIFLLRKILEIPEEKCCSFLQEYGDPSSWIDCCSSCLVVVEKAKVIFNQIIKLQKQYKKLQNAFKNSIAKSAKKSNKYSKFGVSSSVRSHVCQEFTDSSICAIPTLKIEKDISNLDIIIGKDTSCSSSRFEDTDCTQSQSVELDSSIYQHYNDNEEYKIHRTEPLQNMEHYPLQMGQRYPLKIEEQVSLQIIEQDPLQIMEEDPLQLHEIGESVSCLVNPYDIQNKILISHAEEIRGGLPTKERIHNRSNLQLGSIKKIVNSSSRRRADERRSKEANNSNVQERKVKRPTDTHVNKQILHKCDICSKGFTNFEVFNEHVHIHTRQQPFGCYLCGKLFALSENLELHVQLHRNGKFFRYKCEFCGKSFHTNCNLKGHLRTHTGEKPFECEFCQRTFAHHSTLRNHTRTHTGEKYKCELCERSFSRLGILKTHLRKCH